MFYPVDASLLEALENTVVITFTIPIVHAISQTVV